MIDAWYGLPAAAQDTILALLLLLPVALGARLVGAGLSTGAPVRALLLRHRGVAATFTLLIALSVGIATAVLVQERGLRQGSARAADPFDVIVAAPGSEVTAMLAAVYLQSAPLPLVSAERLAAVAAHPATRFAAPLAFGDSVDGAPLVGTTREFVAHLAARTTGSDEASSAGSALAQGRTFERADEAVVGAATPFAIGDVLTPAHGTDFVEAEHTGTSLTVVGRLPAGGTPWDGAVVAPVETMWLAHGLGDGHAPGEGDRPTGPPFDPERAPGVPAVVAIADSYAGAYALRGDFTDAATMAFFPGEVLARLHAVLGDVRRAMSALALATQVLVAVAVLLALSLLIRGFGERFAMLRALGAPRRYTFAVVWRYALVLVVAGTVAGSAFGVGFAWLLGRVLATRTGVDMGAGIATSDAVPVAAFVLTGAVLALLPAWAAARR